MNDIPLYSIIMVLLYLMLMSYLVYRGYRTTHNTTDYLLAGRKTHPWVMALSYGATFISTSAIVGFGGVAGLFGMSLLWLTFCNIFVGIFIAFVVFGGRTRQMGHRLDAHTFPEFLGRRFDSRFIQVFAGLVIFLFIPLYAAAVLIGACEFIATKFGLTYNVALFLFSSIIAVYVVAGGLKGVMYADALQGAIMFVGMLILLVVGYVKIGGIVEGHRTLTGLADLVPENLQAMGHRGWTAMPAFGWGDPQYNLWWIVVSTITLGVGIGVLAQPQLVVRFMTVRSRKELNRATLVGGLFILVMTGVAFTIGSLSNAFFTEHGEPFHGRVVEMTDPQRHHAVVALAEFDESTQTWRELQTDDGGRRKINLVLDPEMPYLADAAVAGPGGEPFPVARGRAISIVYAQGNPDQIIPLYITAAMPTWFGLIFLLTLLAAAMSTLSSQFHALGSSIGRDVYEQCVRGSVRRGASPTRVGIVIGIVIAVVISYHARGDYIIARATAIFFGLCASTFLPAFVGGLFFRRISKAAVIASMVGGFLATAFWLVLVKAQEAQIFGLAERLTGGKPSILADYPNWAVVDPLLIALPISTVILIAVSLLGKAPDREHLRKCFAD